MYSLHGHGDMIGDAARSDAYESALRACVAPGSVVADIGTGTGFFAILACRFGARRVFAIESGEVVDVARRIAAANGCAGAIEFIEATSTEIELPEPVDVVVSDLHGVLPFFQGHLVAMIDARRRFLRPGGVLIPRRETLWAACAEAFDLHRPVTTPWSDNKYGIDMRAARELAANQWFRARVPAGALISEPQHCGEIDYARVEEPDFDARVTAVVTRKATGHGVCVWFDSELAPGVVLSNSPRSQATIYGSAFFPWPEPVALEAGDSVCLHISAKLMRGDYLWTWESEIAPRPERAALRFRQSDFFSEPLSAARVRRQAAAHVPRLTDEGRIDGFILELMDERIPLGDIARRVASSFPARFSRWQEALTRVADLSARYSR
jgi:protein arginine N-methyltransferase 1